MPDAVEVIRRNQLLSVASKEEGIAAYIDQHGPCKGSMSGNDKPPRRGRSRQERRERER